MEITGRKQDIDYHLSEGRYEADGEESWTLRKRTEAKKKVQIKPEKKIEDSDVFNPALDISGYMKKTGNFNSTGNHLKNRKPAEKKRFGKRSFRTTFVSRTVGKKQKKEEADELFLLDDTDYSGQRNLDDAEYSGNRKSLKKKDIGQIIKKAAAVVMAQLLLFAKLVVVAMTKIFVVIAVVTIVVVVSVVAVIQNATYDFVADEEIHIREIMSRVTGEFSAEINLQKSENDCEVVVCNGELADWKEVIAFWWTLRTHVTETEQWDNYFDGDDYEDIKYIFYQFNQVEYVITGGTEGDTTSKKTLTVNITNATIDEMIEHWGLDNEQKAYLNAMLQDDEIWEEILGTSELSRIAFAEIGNGADKYREWYGNDTDDISCQFTEWCMNEAGLITTGFFSKADNSQTLMEQMNKTGFFRLASERNEKEGDIIFLKLSGEIRSGIITRTDGKVLYITMNGYTGHTVVEEVPMSNDSGLIKGYAHIDGFFVEALSNAPAVTIAGNGELLWPVGAEYYIVTSAYGRRESPGGIGSTNHHGTDIAVPTGTPIVACAAGTVTAASYTSAMGNYIKIDHGNGLTTIYMHNSSLKVVVGQTVQAGDVIALAGSTGNSTGPHCHLGVILNGAYTDPAPYLGIPSNWTGDASSYISGGQ